MGSLLSSFKDKTLVKAVSSEIAKVSEGMKLRIMHVCGTHEWAITRNGLRDMLPENVRIVAGPGCPVCVTPGSEIDSLSELASSGKAVVTTFGDVLRVPGNHTSLSDAKSMGGDVRVVYSVSDALVMAKDSPGREFAHFSIGFETTAPMTAVEIIKGVPKNFSVFSAHKLIPPAMDFLLKSGAVLDGFICPGHVSTIIGVTAYEGLAEKYRKPMVIAGFEALDIMIGILNIARQKASGTCSVENEYRRAVKPEGNEIAIRSLERVFELRDATWRGIGKIAKSGMSLRKEYSEYDAALKFGMQTAETEEMPGGCSCGEVLLGALAPEGCQLFGGDCTPEHPIGPCMVSIEGTCSIAYKNRKIRDRI